MSHPFSTKGTVGRFKFLCYLLLYILSPILGLFVALVMISPTSPLEGVWVPVIAMIGFYLLGQRLVDCAYIKRARAIGVEIENTWMVPFYFLGFQPGATLKDLLFRPRSSDRPISGDRRPHPDEPPQAASG